MPELPEVETTLRGIESHILNKKILNIVIRRPNLRWPIPVIELTENLLSQHFKSIERRGKYLILKVETGSLMIHLGMSGCLRVFKKGKKPEKHDHIDIVFKDNILRYTDPRRFGSFLWTKNIDLHPLIKDLGPEPLSNYFSGKYLYDVSRNRKMPIKNFIMNSKIVVGVGNIYANEALFLSGIKPQKKAGLVSSNKYEDLAIVIKDLLKKAIDQGGTTLKDFVGGDNKPGYFQQDLLVYGRKGKECCQCSTLLSEIRIGQRSSIFCKNCQK